MIDNQLPVFLNILCNFCSSNSDIVDIFEKSSIFISAPLREYIEQFVFESKRGIPMPQAFKNLEDKVESRRFIQLLKNIYICSKHEANFKEILNKSRVILNHYYVEKERRKKAVREGRIAIMLMIVLGAVLFYLVSTFAPSLLVDMKNNAEGNLISIYLLFVLIFALYKLTNLDRINI